MILRWMLCAVLFAASWFTPGLPTDAVTHELIFHNAPLHIIYTFNRKAIAYAKYPVRAIP